MDSFLEFNTVGLIDTASINPDVAQAVTHSPITQAFIFWYPSLRFPALSLLLTSWNVTSSFSLPQVWERIAYGGGLP
jgi:hypothetical protein